MSLYPASFCTPRPNLPVTLGVSLLPPFVFQFPMMKRISFLDVSSKKVLQVFIEPFNFSFFSITAQGIDLDYHVIEWFSVNFQMFKLVLKKAEEPEIKLPTFAGSSKKQESSRKTYISALLTMPKT